MDSSMLFIYILLFIYMYLYIIKVLNYSIYHVIIYTIKGVAIMGNEVNKLIPVPAWMAIQAIEFKKEVVCEFEGATMHYSIDQRFELNSNHLKYGKWFMRVADLMTYQGETEELEWNCRTRCQCYKTSCDYCIRGWREDYFEALPDSDPDNEVE